MCWNEYVLENTVFNCKKCSPLPDPRCRPLPPRNIPPAPLLPLEPLLPGELPRQLGDLWVPRPPAESDSGEVRFVFTWSLSWTLSSIWSGTHFARLPKKNTYCSWNQIVKDMWFQHELHWKQVSICAVHVQYRSHET